MAKIDWLTHCRLFLSQKDTSTKARKAYALECGLNENSFRRELTNYKKEADQGESNHPDQPVSSKADQKTDHKADQKKKTDQKKQSDQKSRTKADSNKNDKNQQFSESKGSEGRVAKSDQGKTDQNGGTTRARYDKARDISRPASTNVTVRPDGTRTFTIGNTASLIHGGYAEKLFLNQEVADLAEMPITDMHKMMKSRFAVMEMIRTDVVRQTQADYENGRAHTKEVFEDGEIVQIPMTYEEAIFSSMLAGMKEQTKLYDSVVKAEQTQFSLLMQYQKMSRFTHEEAVKEIEAVMERYQEDQLSAIEAGILLESKGIKLPSTLRGLIAREIEEMDPKGKEQDGGLTEEQLNEIRSQALKFESEEDGKVADNHAVLAQLLKEADSGI
ncbi:hypothetical protein NTE19_003408 [Vibrio fluvialis]|nr:hypothetical protein [Vibrio fluvialis]